MKIVYLHQYFATKKSVTSTRSYVFAKYLVEQGHEVVVITTENFLKGEVPYKKDTVQNYYCIDGIEIRAQINPYSNYMGTTKRIKSFFSFMQFAYQTGKKIDGVDLMFSTSTPLTIAIPTLRLHRKLKIPYVFEVRDLWPEAPKQMGVIKSKPALMMLRSLEKKVYQKAEHIISLSPGMTTGIEKTGIPSTKITMIPNLSDLELFEKNKANEPKTQAFIEKYKLEDSFVMLHLGAMGEANGLEYIMEAAKGLKEKHADHIKIIIGGDGKTKPLLEEYCAKHKLDNVIFLGYVPREDVPYITAAANITMTSFKPLPILATNSPNKFFDSLAAGKPIIVNSNGWTKDIVEDNEIGYYVNPLRPNELTDVLIILQNETVFLAGLEEKIRGIAKDNYNAIDLAEKATKIMESVINERKY